MTNLLKFALTVRDLRDAQKRYFKDRGARAHALAIEHEKTVDQMLALIFAESKDQDILADGNELKEIPY